MDSRTLSFYEREAPHVAARYEGVPSPIARYYSASFSPGGRVLDVGAGTGRDMAALQSAGFEAYGLEPADALREAAFARHPELRGRLEKGALPFLGVPFGGNFDGVMCSAVLMHVPDAELFDAALALRAALRQHGRLLLSLPLSRHDVGEDERDGDGRLFHVYRPEYLQLLFERIGLQLIDRWESDDGLGRESVRWYTLLFELRNAGALRPVDQIEGILNRDKKEATYKLALFRALAELATQEPRVADWRSDGRVGVPLKRIAEKWLFYYWPIIAAAVPIAQSRGEAAGAKPIAFRDSLSKLIEPYRHDGAFGGLTSFAQHMRAGELEGDAKRNYDEALREIANTVRSGPVQFAGGALGTGPVFEYDKTSRRVLMANDLWRELSLLGHWIVDAVILRWADLTAEIGHRDAIDCGAILSLLRATPDVERAAGQARAIYRANGPRRCVWTGQPVTDDRLAIDHAIPFSLWRNNDLWNLLPADKTANCAKSDRLPSSGILLDSRARVLESWTVLAERLPVPFARQAQHLLGPRPPGRTHEMLDGLFARLREAIEITALQRGVERWP